MNNSWGGGGFSVTLRGAIEVANEAGILFIAAAGNSSDPSLQDNDLLPFFPASYSNENIIAVAATDYNDNLASFSHYGFNSVDVAAPGVDILSTLLPYAHLSSSCHDDDGNGYGTCSGTSMATPHVAGLAALIWAELGERSDLPMKTKDIILSSVDPLPDLKNKVQTEGRINAYNALMQTRRPFIDVINPIGGPAGTNVTISGINFGHIQGSGYVTFHDGAVALITSWSDTQIDCTVPEGVTTGEVTVTTDKGTGNGMLFTVCEVNARYYRDADGDGYGDPGRFLDACSVPEGYISDNTDCDDIHYFANPGIEDEYCDNGVDENCNGQVDEPGCRQCNLSVPGDFATIQEAIDFAFDGCVITVGNGTYYENISITGKSITLKSWMTIAILKWMKKYVRK